MNPTLRTTVPATMAKRLQCWCMAALAMLEISGGSYLVGVGTGDVTGPVADVNLMGYAQPLQTARGLHIRLYARAFIFAEEQNNRSRFAFVNVDACMASQLVTITVLERLQGLYGGLYNADNVAISGTHTHASAAGFLQYVLYDITSAGFVSASFEALVDGIVESIMLAHENLQPAEVKVNEGELLDANINRSPTAYLNNPLEERQLYPHDVDKNMTLLKITDSSSRPLGALSWFAVHCTSMNNTNRLLSGDSKGAASLFMEDQFRSAGGKQASPFFTAAFAQSNVGDTSPNVGGAFCLDTGLPCDLATSTCDGRNEMCFGRGPAWPDDTKSTEIIAKRQLQKALDLWASAEVELSGSIDYRHKFLNMSDIQVLESRWTRAGRTCPPAMGMAFAAGTTDGPGAFNFKQNDTRGPTLWRLVSRFLPYAADTQQRRCQAPKPILLNTGYATYPYTWQPSVVEVGILRLGQLLILCVPGEFTSMAGRRLRRAVTETVRSTWGPVHVVVAGLTGTYSSYITTFEEYQAQRYEGASTLYGPHTLDAYIQEFVAMAAAMVEGKPVASDVEPPNLLDKQVSLLPPVMMDFVPPASKFGDVVTDAEASYSTGQTVYVVFRAGCPRNNLRRNGTFLVVEKLDVSSQQWQGVHSDRDWCTRFHWHRPSKLSPLSFATIQWDIPEAAEPGMYRIQHFGDHKFLPFLPAQPYEGVSREFEVTAVPATGSSPCARPPDAMWWLKRRTHFAGDSNDDDPPM